jgi:hypothetical protein
VPGTVLSMQNILLGQRKVMQIRQRETLSHQRAIIHEVCLSSAQFSAFGLATFLKLKTETALLSSHSRTHCGFMDFFK